jgi:hypothetical protein
MNQFLSREQLSHFVKRSHRFRYIRWELARMILVTAALLKETLFTHLHNLPEALISKRLSMAKLANDVQYKLPKA